MVYIEKKAIIFLSVILIVYFPSPSKHSLVIYLFIFFNYDEIFVVVSFWVFLLLLLFLNKPKVEHLIKQNN